jgi:hypothetical protein
MFLVNSISSLYAWDSHGTIGAGLLPGYLKSGM